MRTSLGTDRALARERPQTAPQSSRKAERPPLPGLPIINSLCLIVHSKYHIKKWTTGINFI
ncbi:MAG: hypothetical protein ACK58O_02150, partial [Brevundimonas sp.]